MEPEDLEPRFKKPQAVNLEAMSVEGIKEYIAGLKAEIARAEAAILKKGNARAAADAVFGKK